MIYPIVRELAEDSIPVSVTMRVLNLARQPYYRWLRQPQGPAEQLRLERVRVLRELHQDDPEFGYRFLHDAAADQGVHMSSRTAWKLCRDNALASTTQRKRAGRPRSGPAVHDDLVRRVFHADGPNQVWLTDITEHPTREGKLYVCAFKDLWSNRIVGYAMSERMTSRLAVDALGDALARRGPGVKGCIVHSDRGSQFRSRGFVRALNRHGLRGSMGRVGACGDNAAMESFFSLLQKNVLNRHVWDTRQQLRTAITVWIERTYHRRRKQDRLGKLTPIDFEIIMTPMPTTVARQNTDT